MAAIWPPMPRPPAASKASAIIWANTFFRMSYSKTELMIALLAREVAGLAPVGARALFPLPAPAGLLAPASGPARGAGLGRQPVNFFPHGGGELVDCAARGRVDGVFV